MLALLSILCHCKSRAWLSSCNLWKLIAGQILGACCLLFFSAGAVVWLWTALDCWRRSTERLLESAKGATPTSQGLPAAAAVAAALAPAREQSWGLQLPTVSAGAPPRHAEGSLGDDSSADGGARSSMHQEPPLRGGGGSSAPSRLGHLHRRKHRLDQALSKGCSLVSMLAALLSVFVFVWFDLCPYEAFSAELDKRWGFMLEGPDAVPVWLGEFGSNYHSDLEWAHIQRYILQKDLDWAYWSINGEKFNGVGESFGILGKDSATVRDEWKLRDLRALIRAAGLLPPERPPSAFAFAKSVDARPFSTLHLDRV